MGSRGSPLALRQTEIVREKLAHFGIETELRIVKTSGDIFIDKPLHMISGWGVFVAEIDELMLSGQKIDLAVHSMKDLPTKRPEQLAISAILKRDSPFDIMVSRDGSKFDGMNEGSVIGTSSMRRSAQIKRARPDLEVKSLRGNLQTRLRKLNQGDYDAIFLAEAGVQRMGIKMQYQVLDRERFVPSANQGTIVVVARKDTQAELYSRSIDDMPTRIETMIERKILEAVGGGCIVPMATHAEVVDQKARVLAEVLSLDGKKYVRIDEAIKIEDGFADKAYSLGKKLMEMGGEELVAEAVSAFGAR